MESSVTEQYKDLGRITQSKDGDYWEVEISDLDFATQYSLEAAWVFSDKTKGTSPFSDPYNFTTPEQEGLLAPQFREQDLDAISSILYINWSGLNSSLVPYDSSIFKQVNVWIKGGDFGEQYVRYASFFTKAGTIQINATKVSTYCVKLQAETKDGKFSPFSNEFCVTLLEQPDPVYEVRHEWVKRDLVLFWKFPVNLPKNSMADSFAVQLIADGKDITLYTNVDKTKIPPLEHKIVFTEGRLAAIFGQVTAFQTDYDAFIFVRDKNLQTSTVVGYNVTAYVDPLTPPVISAIKGPMSYIVSFTNNSEFDKIYIEDSTDGGDTWVDQGSYTSNPAYVPTTNSLARQVRARFSRVRGGLTGYSNIVSVTPDKIDPTDETPPAVPTVNFVSSTSSTITVNIVNSDTSTKSHRLRFRESGATLYQTDIVPYTAATTPYTFGGLKPNTTYNISAASYDSLNNLSAFSSDINSVTQSLSANPPSSVSLTAAASGVLGSWTAPSVQPARVDRYKIELWQDLSTDVLITTQFAFSTNISFGGLSAGSYYIKVQTQDMYGTLSDPVQSSSVSVSGVEPTDGQVPSSSPAATVNPLYGALEVKWTAITNSDPVTYEIHLSTTNNFTPSVSTLALQVTGTFAIIKTLPGTSTSLTYGTTYYVKVLAKDADGPATSYGTQGSGIPSAIDNGDIAANAIRANVIRAGEITADQVNSSALLANKVITVGARSAVVTGASVSAGNITYTTSDTHGFGNGTLVSVTGMSNTAFNITSFAIQSTTTNTFVVVVGGSGASGSLSNQTGVATSTVNTAIKIDASGTGLSASPFKLYSGVGTYADAGTSPGTPFYLDTTGKFSLRDRLYFDGAGLTVNGVIKASSGNFDGAMTVNNGTMKIGTSAGGATGTDGLYINANNYWYSSGNIKIGSASNHLIWEGATLKVTGEINAASGSITGNLTMTGGGSVIARTVANSNNRVNLNYLGLYAYDASGAETTQIISNAEANAPTFRTDRARIGNWTVAPNTISSSNITLTSGSNASSTSIIATNGGSYVGIRPRATDGSDIVLWAGTTNTPAINSSTVGGQAGFQVNADGQLYATGAIISGKITVQEGSSLGGLLNDTSKIYYSSSTPPVPATGHKSGDAWVDTGNNYILKIWNTTLNPPAWTIAQDSESARTIANLKNRTFYATQLTTPTRPNLSGQSFVSGDLWINSSNKNKPYRYDGSSWVIVADADATDAIEKANSALAKVTNYEDRFGTGVNAGLLEDLKVNTQGRGIYSSFVESGNTYAKSSYDSTVTGFYIGWDSGAGVLYPSLNIGNNNAFVKWTSRGTGTLEVKGTIRATAGAFEGNVTAGAGAITIGAGGISTASGKFSIDTAGNAYFGGSLTSGTTFSLGNGTLSYGGGTSDVVLNGATLSFTGASNIIFGDDNNYGGDATVVLNQNAQLTKGRAFHYGGTTIPTVANQSRQIYNSKLSRYDTVPFVAGDIWMTVD